MKRTHVFIIMMTIIFMVPLTTASMTDGAANAVLSSDNAAMIEMIEIANFDATIVIGSVNDMLAEENMVQNSTDAVTAEGTNLFTGYNNSAAINVSRVNVNCSVTSVNTLSGAKFNDNSGTFVNPAMAQEVFTANGLPIIANTSVSLIKANLANSDRTTFPAKNSAHQTYNNAISGNIITTISAANILNLPTSAGQNVEANTDARLTNHERTNAEINESAIGTIPTTNHKVAAHTANDLVGAGVDDHEFRLKHTA